MRKLKSRTTGDGFGRFVPSPVVPAAIDVPEDVNSRSSNPNASAARCLAESRPTTSRRLATSVCGPYPESVPKISTKVSVKSGAPRRASIPRTLFRTASKVARAFASASRPE